MYTSYGWELTNLLQGQDEEYLLEVLTENYRRLKIKIKKYDTRNYRTNAQRVIRY